MIVVPIVYSTFLDLLRIDVIGPNTAVGLVHGLVSVRLHFNKVLQLDFEVVDFRPDGVLVGVGGLPWRDFQWNLVFIVVLRKIGA